MTYERDSEQTTRQRRMWETVSENLSLLSQPKMPVGGGVADGFSGGPPGAVEGVDYVVINEFPGIWRLGDKSVQWIFPNGLQVADGVEISVFDRQFPFFDDDADPGSDIGTVWDITFRFPTPGMGLEFLGTSGIETGSGNRYGNRYGDHDLIFDMMGNAISGAGGYIAMCFENGAESCGYIGEEWEEDLVRVNGGPSGGGFGVVIDNASSVELDRINLVRADTPPNNIDITSTGHVDVRLMSAQDIGFSGYDGGDVFVQAKMITVGDVLVTAERSPSNAPPECQANPNSGCFVNYTRDPGDITLIALAPPGFDPDDSTNNMAAENIITIGGLLDASAPEQSDGEGTGNILLQAVKVVLEEDAELLAQTSITIDAGLSGGPFTEADLFMDMAGTGLPANFVVGHSFVPEPATLTLVLLLSTALLCRRLVT